MSHYVVVTDKNYLSMYAFAKLQAQLTVHNKLNYNFFAGNCSDFVYQTFSNSDLPEKYRIISKYLSDLKEPVAIYSDQEGIRYKDAFKKHPNVANTVVNYRIFEDFSGLVYLLSRGVMPKDIPVN